MITTQEYWNSIGSKKVFEDPLYLNKVENYLNKKSLIVEYGCGYGRLLNLLEKEGYINLLGFDFASKMIERGKQEFPNLQMKLLNESGKIPLKNESVDGIIMSTVLCCMIKEDEKADLLNEIWRVLKHNGVLYLSDFLVCDDARYKEKYEEGFRKYGVKGVYTTSENLTVCHMNSKEVFKLLNKFDIQWFEQFNFKTMNHNPARTFHCIGVKK